MNVPFFSSYHGMTLQHICESFTQKTFRAGELIVRKGEVGQEMYIILRGEVGIFFDDKLERCVVTLGQNK